MPDDDNFGPGSNGPDGSSQSPHGMPFDEVQRLKREPVRFRCLGMSFITLLIIVAAIVFLIRLLRRS